MVEERTEEYYVQVMQLCKGSTEPNVINDQLIRGYIKEYNNENQIIGMNSMPFVDLTELRLPFKNISIIQNLDDLINLKKLCLDNNIIESIEGLETLKNLEWLDLSFNQIKEVYGLDELDNLTDLSLFHNQIKTIVGGLDCCKKLNVLSIGDNQIESIDSTVKYLRKFQRLQVLNLAGNPICSDHQYEYNVIAFLENLVYLDYKYINEEKRQKASDQFHDEVDDYRNTHEAGQDEAENKKKRKREFKKLAQMHIQYTFNIIEYLKDEENNKEDEDNIDVLPEVEGYFQDFQDNITNLNTVFQQRIIELFNQRQEKMQRFKGQLTKAITQAEQEDIELIEKYEAEEKKAIQIFQKDEEQGEEALRELEPKIDVLENTLIEKEFEMVEMIQELIEKYEKVLKAKTEEIKEEGKLFQERCNEFVEIYFKEVDRIKDEELKKFSAENANMEDFTPEQREKYKDKDQLISSINSLHEEYRTKLFDLDEYIVTNYDKEMNDEIQTVRDQQIDRDRNHINEIMILAAEKRQAITKLLESDYDE